MERPCGDRAPEGRSGDSSPKAGHNLYMGRFICQGQVVIQLSGSANDHVRNGSVVRARESLSIAR